MSNKSKPLDVLQLMQNEAKLKKFNEKQEQLDKALAQGIQIITAPATEEDKPNYTNWDYPTWIRNNPNATPEQIKQFFREKKLHDFMIFGKW